MDNINNFKNDQNLESKEELFIKVKIINSKNRGETTFRRLASSYFDKTGKRISKT